jgi:hypothetical protein
MMSNNRMVLLLLPVALLVVLSGLVVAACGSNQTPTTGSPSTPTATYAVGNGSTPASTQPAGTTTSTPQSPGGVQNCGNIKQSSLHRFEDSGLAQQAGACFWQAFQQCRAATLTFQPQGVDTITSHTFLIEKKAGGCTITDTMSHAIVPRPPTVTNYTCTGVVDTKQDLRITGCGAEGDVVVPLVQ